MTMNRVQRLAYTLSLAALIILGSIAPRTALAQLGLGSLVVTVTAPPNGAQVGGTVPVRASVSIVGLLTVAGVQFQVDGANLGAEDTSAPYEIPWNTLTATNGTHTITAVARDSLGVRWTSNTVTVTVFNDTTPPSVSVTSPAAGATVSGTITMTANASDNVGVVGVQFQVDGVNAGAEATSAPYSAPWNTLSAANGSHVVTAVARDAAGNRGTSAAVTVNVFNDTIAPSVSITSPAAGATVSGRLNVTANASDNVGVVGVQFKLDGANLGAEVTAAPYAVSWDSRTASNASHVLTAVARDAAGNQTTSAAVTVNVFNDTIAPSVSVTSPTAGATVSGRVNVTADASDNVGVAGVQFKLDGANLGAEVTVAPYAVSWDTATATNASHVLTAVARDAAGNVATSAAVSVTVANLSPVAIENQQPGSGNWAMWVGGMPADDLNKQIKGYASATSVNKGDSITFYVSAAPAQTYTIDIYRMGYYQGLGGRLLQSVGPLPGVQQPLCPGDLNTGLIECNWSASYTLAVPTAWTSGIFIAKLTSAAGFQNWITFAVRDDARTAGLLYAQPVNTYQAYNNYPNDNATGKSIYNFNSFGAPTVSGTARAVKVSWNRPYADRGAGQFFNWEYYFIRWIERSGYDVKYATSVDTHQHSDRLLGSKGFLSIAHDEYYSKEMYDGLETARAGSVHLAFFGANGVYWQVRFEPSPLTGVADRVMVGYKDRTTDPVQGPTTTVQFRDPLINRPEQTLMGVQFNGQIAFDAPRAPFVVKNSSSWVYTGTGVRDGDQIPGIVGYEMDGSTASAPLPNAIGATYEILSESPYTDSGGVPLVSNATIYQAPSGAWVFGAGITDWAWGLDLDGTADPRIQRITSNILDRFVGKTP